MSKVTIKDVRDRFPGYTKYKRQGNKQLFVCSGDLGLNTVGGDPTAILVSYLTIVGYYDAVLGTWVLTREIYNLTTTKQLNWFARGRNVIWVDSLSKVEK